MLVKTRYVWKYTNVKLTALPIKIIFRTLTSYISFTDISSLVRAAILIFSVKGFTVISNAVPIEKKKRKIFFDFFFYDLLHLGPPP